MWGREPRRPSRPRLNPRILLGLFVAGVAVAGYFVSTSTNPITGRSERVALSPQEEIVLGLQAMPDMVAMHGGLSPDKRAQDLVDRVGSRLVAELATLFPGGANPYQFDFHVLADPRTVNAFALPGGQVFITQALFARLETEGQLAGVLGHEIGHVVERHSAERLAEQGLLEGLVGGVAVATYDPGQPGSQTYGQMAQAVGELVTMKYGRDDELESDRYGVQLCAAAGYDPRAMIRVMEILADASGGEAPPEFFSTHPNPDNRIGRIEEAIDEVFPDGVPGGLIP